MKFFTHLKRQFFLSAFFLLTIALYPAQGERLSLKLSFGPHFIGKGDINNSIESLNSLWTEYKGTFGGNLSGQFKTLRYKPSIEGELRINLISGLALNLAMSYFSDKKEGTVNYQQPGVQEVSHYLLNEVKALPIKLGLSYTYPLPYEFDISLSLGRHIIFVQYSTQENYENPFKAGGKDFTYWSKEDYKFRSESLGYYISIEGEYNIAEFLALGIELEKVWSKVDGFKGPYTFEEFKSWLKPDKQKHIEEGKASLYYYETNNNPLNQYYIELKGEKERPDELNTKNLRQGELNFSGFSLKIGFRFRF